MKTRFFFPFLFAFTVISSVHSVSAIAAEWTGTQVLATVSGERKIGSSETYGLRGQFIGFFVPTGDAKVGFAYAGPSASFKLFGAFDLWLSPQFAASFNFIAGHDAVGPALMATVSKGRFSVFLDSECYFYNGTTYYGFYSVDVAFLGFLSAGAQFEQVDKDWKAGPHIGYAFDKASMSVQYHRGYDAHTARIVLAYAF